MIVYKTTNKITGKIYVGKDLNNNPNYLGSGTYLSNSIAKYGRENFVKEILEICTDHDHLCERERFWISELNAMDPEIGYNILPGGEGWDSKSASIAGILGNKHLTTEKRSKTATYQWQDLTPEERIEKARLFWKNVPFSERSRIAKEKWALKTPEERSRIAQLRADNMSEESRKQRSESQKRTWSTDIIRKVQTANTLNAVKANMPKEEKKKIASNAVKQRYVKMDQAYLKPILQLDLEGNLVRRWESITEIRETQPTWVTRVKLVLDGKLKKTCGQKFQWE